MVVRKTDDSTAGSIPNLSSITVMAAPKKPATIKLINIAGPMTSPKPTELNQNSATRLIKIAKTIPLSEPTIISFTHPL